MNEREIFAVFATKAAKLEPCEGPNLTTLGVAQYRVGEFVSAAESLTNSLELDPGGRGVPCCALFLAMAHWRLGEEEQTHQWYDKAAQWPADNNSTDKELLRFRAEAEALLANESGAPQPEKEPGRAVDSPSAAKDESPEKR